MNLVSSDVWHIIQMHFTVAKDFRSEFPCLWIFFKSNGSCAKESNFAIEYLQAGCLVMKNVRALSIQNLD